MLQMKFAWEGFYTEMANQLLTYKNNRRELLQIIKDSHERAGLKYPFIMQGQLLEDVCPFTVMGTFNNEITQVSRLKLMKEYAVGFNINNPIPKDLDGIPVLATVGSWFFKDGIPMEREEFENLWELFEATIEYADHPTELSSDKFINWFDMVRKFKGVRWNITTSLFWVRPSTYLNLDLKNRNLLSLQSNEFTDDIQKITNFKKMISGRKYMDLIEVCKSYFDKEDFPFDDFKELSFKAWTNTIELSSDKLEEDVEKIIKYWLYAPGEKSRLWDEYYENSIMGIGWEEMGDLSKYSSKEHMRKKMKELFGQEYSHKNSVHATWQFVNEIQKGDIIFVKNGLFEIIGRGVVESDYYYDKDSREYHNRRKVRWTHKGEWAHPGRAVTKTLTEITPYIDYVKKLNALFSDGEEGIIEVEPEYDKYTKENFLEEVFMNEDQYQTLVSLLRRKKNLILQGAPGVGKTYAAKRLAYSIMGEKDASRVMLVQFHQSYSYEDFVMGYRPTNTGFTLTKGPFYKFCKDAEVDSERDYYFIIDEINRGNLSKIFGELMMLIESDKRNEKIQLIYADEKFSIPKNVHIIGMMNTADRSLAMMDYALRRRFAFFDMEPAFDSELFKNIVEDGNLPQYKVLVDIVKSLNEHIGKDEALGNGFRVGHSYLCPKGEVSTTWLNSTIRYEILPLLNEYWFDEPDKVKLWEDRLYGALK